MWLPQVESFLYKSKRYEQRELPESQNLQQEKNDLTPWQERTWCIPPKADADVVYRMEALLELYREPYDPRRPIVCMEEMSQQRIAETRSALPLQEGQPARFDYEYERRGVCQLFMFLEPLRGWRTVPLSQPTLCAS